MEFVPYVFQLFAQLLMLRPTPGGACAVRWAYVAHPLIVPLRVQAESSRWGLIMQSCTECC